MTISVAKSLLMEGRVTDVERLISGLVSEGPSPPFGDDSTAAHATCLLARLRLLNHGNTIDALRLLEPFERLHDRLRFSPEVRAEAALWLGWARVWGPVDVLTSRRGLGFLNEADDAFDKVTNTNGRLWVRIGQSLAHFRSGSLAGLRLSLEQASKFHTRGMDQVADIWLDAFRRIATDSQRTPLRGITIVPSADPLALEQPSLVLEAVIQANSDAVLDAEAYTRQQGAILSAEGLVHASRPMQDALNDLVRQWGSRDPILLCGATGSGKSFVSRHLHDVLRGPDAPFVSAGATLDNSLLADARGGTLFIHHVERLERRDQQWLYGALASMAEDAANDPDVRLVVTCTSNPSRAVADGDLDESLYELLYAGRVMLPSISNRSEDIPVLIRWYLDRLSASVSRVTVSPEAEKILESCSWPGNVRQLFGELESCLGRTSLEPVTVIRADDISAGVRREAQAVAANRNGRSLQNMMADVERSVILEALRERGGSVSAAAADLGLTRQGLYKKLRRFCISPGDVVSSVAVFD